MKRATQLLFYFSLLLFLGASFLKSIDPALARVVTITGFCFFVASLIFRVLQLREHWGIMSADTRRWTTILFTAVMFMVVATSLRFFHVVGARYFSYIGMAILLVFLLLVIYRLLSNKIKGKPTSVETLMSLGLTVDDLNKFEGVYVNKEMPMTITVTNRQATLVAQANGQSAFYLDAISPKEFRYESGKIGIDFDLDKNELILKQHGGFFPFIKE